MRNLSGFYLKQKKKHFPENKNYIATNNVTPYQQYCHSVNLVFLTEVQGKCILVLPLDYY